MNLPLVAKVALSTDAVLVAVNEEDGDVFVLSEDDAAAFRDQLDSVLTALADRKYSRYLANHTARRSR